MSPISIYIHWPFCLSLCPYCDFNSHVASKIDHDLWLESYKIEINHFKEKLKGRKIQSVFFGGGTPSLMNPKTVEGVLETLSNIGVMSDQTEITLEANPTSYETEKFKEFKLAGVNRVSIGVQSLQADALKILGRKHSAIEAIAAINSAANLFDRYSFDLIYAIPGQTLENWQQELEKAMSFAGGHISLYQLTIEKGTPFYQIFKQGKMQLPSNDASANMYEWTNDYLKQKSYVGYEISNYAKLDQECLHNLAYWNYNEYLGIGPGAHSRLHDKTNVNALMMTHKPEKWLSSVRENGHGTQTNNALSQQEIIEEIVMMGTRLRGGMSLSHFQKITGKIFDDVLQQKSFLHYEKCGLVFKNNTHFGLTEKGLLLHNYLIPRLI
jgi:putative oxygen-independent coproporphyrinogen III oxidase